VSLAKALDKTGATANTASPEIIVTPGVEAFFRTEAPRRGWGDRMLRKDGSAVSAPGFGPMTLER
jgi:NAD(P)-dependent dehydrogenase (short-subunit alcohol dehydrogenase family)